MPAPALATDAAFTKTVMLVIDFEATTPAGHRPQPVEVAALAAQHVPGRGLGSRQNPESSAPR
jgi:DNA polymerase-3 subunit epsilon